MTFSYICDKFLDTLGYTPKQCLTDDEAKKYASEMADESELYPVVYFKSDTTGEKDFEEFYIEGETLNMERFESLGVIEDTEARTQEDIDELFANLIAIFEHENFTKAEIVAAMKQFIPNFEHEEKGKNLDQKM